MMSEKTDKTSHKKRPDKFAEGRMYAVISPQSIVTVAESCGISGLNEEIASKLGEDVTYRLREIIRGGSVHMRNNSEKVLRSTHIAQVLPNCSEMQVHGYLSGGSSEFLYVPNADVFVSEYNEQIIDLHQIAFLKETLMQKRECFVRGMLFHEDFAESSLTEEEPSTSTSSNLYLNNYIPSHLIAYYTKFAKVILCKHGKVFLTVLKDLQTNSKINLIIPLFLNLLIEGLQELPRGSDACEHLILMLRSLTLNQHIYRDAAVVVNGLLTALLMYSVDPLPSEVVSVSKDFEHRELAADTVTMVMEHWYGCDDVMLFSIMQRMQTILLDPGYTVHSHLGALTVLYSFGEDALNRYFWPYIEKYLDFVSQLHGNSASFMELDGCLLKAAGHLYPQVFECTEDSLEEKNTLMWIVAISDRVLYSYFGDSLCAQWRYPLQETLVNENQSGEDIVSSKETNTELEEFLQTKREHVVELGSERSVHLQGEQDSRRTFTSSSSYKNSAQQDSTVEVDESVWASIEKEGVASSFPKEEIDLVIGVEADVNAKTEKDKYWSRGDVRNSAGHLSDMFKLSMTKKKVVKISGESVPALKRKLQQVELDSSHKTFIFSYYHKKCLQLNHVGKFTNAHSPVWKISNFTGVLSTNL